MEKNIEQLIKEIEKLYFDLNVEYAEKGHVFVSEQFPLKVVIVPLDGLPNYQLLQENAEKSVPERPNIQVTNGIFQISPPVRDYISLAEKTFLITNKQYDDFLYSQIKYNQEKLSFEISPQLTFELPNELTSALGITSNLITGPLVLINYIMFYSYIYKNTTVQNGDKIEFSSLTGNTILSVLRQPGKWRLETKIVEKTFPFYFPIGNRRWIKKDTDISLKPLLEAELKRFYSNIPKTLYSIKEIPTVVWEKFPKSDKCLVEIEKPTPLFTTSVLQHYKYEDIIIFDLPHDSTLVDSNYSFIISTTPIFRTIRKLIVNMENIDLFETIKLKSGKTVMIAKTPLRCPVEVDYERLKKVLDYKRIHFNGGYLYYNDTITVTFNNSTIVPLNTQNHMLILEAKLDELKFNFTLDYLKSDKNGFKTLINESPSFIMDLYSSSYESFTIKDERFGFNVVHYPTFFTKKQTSYINDYIAPLSFEIKKIVSGSVNVVTVKQQTTNVPLVKELFKIAPKVYIVENVKSNVSKISITKDNKKLYFPEDLMKEWSDFYLTVKDFGDISIIETTLSKPKSIKVMIDENTQLWICRISVVVQK